MKNILGLVLIICFACKGQKEISKEKQQVVNNNLVLLMEDNYSSLSTADNVIIRDQKALQKFFAKINRVRKPGIPLPEIDFSKNVLIVVCEGEHAQGDSVALEVLKETEEEIELHTKKYKGKVISSAMVSPFKVYKMALSKKEIIIK